MQRELTSALALSRRQLRARMSGYLLRPEGVLPTCASIAFFACFVGTFAYASLPALADPPANLSKAALDVKQFRPVILVTIGWTALYFCFLQGQAAAAFWIHRQWREAGNKKDDGSSPTKRPMQPLSFADVKYGPSRTAHGRLILTMDRSVGNLLEQTPPFLMALWLHAFTVSPHDAAWYGWVWLVLRATYPVAFAHPSMTPALWGVQRIFGISWVNFITWPSYAIVWTMLYKTACASEI